MVWNRDVRMLYSESSSPSRRHCRLVAVDLLRRVMVTDGTKDWSVLG